MTSRTLIAQAAIAFVLANIGPAHATEPAKPTPSVVIVHGAFADGSDWNRVIPLLQARGVQVTAVQNPLSSLEDDVAATRRAIALQPGQVVLVGHSWGGTVITEAGQNDQVAALVYVSAFAPDAGQSTGELGKGYPTPPGLAHLVPDASGFVRLSNVGMAQHFAQDLPTEQTSVMAATQGPIRGSAFDQKVSVAAWKTRPSWFIVSEADHMIAPELQRDMAKRIGAKVIALPTSHVPQQVRPEAVAAVILEAVKRVEAQAAK